ncbi:AMP-binding protein [Streptomyces tricolor]|nr:AMP-binding protein [Streptomyces tricolor]
MTLLRGGSVVLRHGFEPGDVLAAIQRERITHTWLLPPLLYQLLDHPDLPRTDLSSLRRISYGGTAASPARSAGGRGAGPRAARPVRAGRGPAHTGVGPRGPGGDRPRQPS